MARVLGVTRSSQLRSLIGAVVTNISTTGLIGMDSAHGDALAELRAFNYQRIYNRPESLHQGEAVVEVLKALVERFNESPHLVPDYDSTHSDTLTASVTYVAGMTDRFAFDTAVRLLDWPVDRLPQGIVGDVSRP